MPTGYTAAVEDGKVTDFKTFAMTCARAFGALVTMRDDDLDTPVPEEFEPSDYHSTALAKATADRAKEGRWTDAEWQKAAEIESERRRGEKEKSDNRRRLVLERYKTMRAKVVDWKPPTKDHKGLKDFMLEQIDMCVKTESREDDELTDRFYGQRSGREWKKERLDHLDWEIKYHAEEGEKEVQRTKERNAWVKALRESLKETR